MTDTVVKFSRETHSRGWENCKHILRAPFWRTVLTELQESWEDPFAGRFYSRPIFTVPPTLSTIYLTSYTQLWQFYQNYLNGIICE